MKNGLSPRGLRKVLAVGLTAASTFVAAVSAESTGPPHFEDGFGLTVVRQPVWADGDDARTFVFSVASEQVPNPTLLPGQAEGRHDIMVTLPAEYDSETAEDYPVLYSLHGNPDRPNTVTNQQLAERATRNAPLITVQPNGVRSWYSNWVNPGNLGPQNWETFHLDQLIPLIDANLRTIADRKGRAIAGHSMGGFGAFHYAEHRPDLFSYVGSFSGGLDLLDPRQRGAVIGTSVLPQSGTPTVAPDAIFGPAHWPLDGVWNARSPAQHVDSLRGMGVAMYAGDGGDLAVDPARAVIEKAARDTAVVTSSNLTAAGIPHHFIDYGDGDSWAPGCTGKHAQLPCLQADLDHFVSLIMGWFRRP